MRHYARGSAWIIIGCIHSVIGKLTGKVQVIKFIMLFLVLMDFTCFCLKATTNINDLSGFRRILSCS